jgi:tetratricopeptide (TPR) repeat protein
MIVRNEAERLEACLASVRGFADELVLLDTGSSDATVAIAQRCGAVVHQMDWPGDFEPARNEALKHVSGDWVLVLDADEQLLEEAKQPLRQLMAKPELLLINLLRFERGALQSPYSNVSRLFRRHPDIHWSGKYHTMVDDSVAALIAREPHWRIADCPLPALVHDGYRPQLLADGGKAARLRAAMEDELALKPGDPYACAKLGSLEVSEGNRRRGIELLRLGLAHCPPNAHPERYELLLHLAMAMGTATGMAMGPDSQQESISLYRQALALPLPARLTLAARLNLAQALLEQGEVDEAAALASGACQAAPELALAWFQLGVIERQRGQLAAAIAAYRQSLQLDPNAAASHQNLAVCLLLAGDIPGCRQGFSSAIRLLQQQGRTSEAAALLQQAGSLVKLELTP